MKMKKMTVWIKANKRVNKNQSNAKTVKKNQSNIKIIISNNKIKHPLVNLRKLIKKFPKASTLLENHLKN